MKSRAVLLACLCVCQTPAGVVHAADSSEFWPEVSGFVALSPRTRIFLNAAYAEAKEADDKSLDLAAYLDISLKPILRKELLAEDGRFKKPEELRELFGKRGILPDDTAVCY